MSFALRRTTVVTGCAAALALCACPSSGGERVNTESRDTLASALTKASEHDTVTHEQALGAADTATISRATDTTITNAKPGTLRIASLDPLADSISDRMVFYALIQTKFVAATRGKRLLMDLGRYDGTLAGAKQKRAFEEAAKVLSPVHPGDRFVLHGPWGEDSATVTGYSVWNKRIVATLALPALIDSMARSGVTLVALATKIVPDSARVDSARVDSARAPAPAPPAAVAPPDSIVLPDSATVANALTPGCARDSISLELALRISELADSLAVVLEADTAKLTDRLKKSVKVQKSQALGCFGHWRVILLVNQSAGDYEYVHQLGLLVDTAGVAVPLGVRDLRFKAHEVIKAFDADGDGVDDLAVKGYGNRIGATVILHYSPERRRLEYIMEGFAWEVF
jgi:hypothetical protein